MDGDGLPVAADSPRTRGRLPVECSRRKRSGNPGDAYDGVGADEPRNRIGRAAGPSEDGRRGRRGAGLPGPTLAGRRRRVAAASWRLLRALVPAGPDDLFITGDGHQRIYRRNRVVLGRCGIDIRGRSRKLQLNYRTTEETRRWAARLLAGRRIDDLDGGADDDRGITSLTRGPTPLLRRFEGRDEQCAFIAAWLKRLQSGRPAAARRLRGRPDAARARRRRGRAGATRPAARRARSRRRRRGRKRTWCGWPPCTASRGWSSTA